jgi:hypothetical protein
VGFAVDVAGGLWGLAVQVAGGRLEMEVEMMQMACLRRRRAAPKTAVRRSNGDAGDGRCRHGRLWARGAQPVKSPPAACAPQPGRSASCRHRPIGIAMSQRCLLIARPNDPRTQWHARNPVPRRTILYTVVVVQQPSHQAFAASQRPHPCAAAATTRAPRDLSPDTAVHLALMYDPHAHSLALSTSHTQHEGGHQPRTRHAA